MKCLPIFAALMSFCYSAYAADDNICDELSFGADSTVCVCDVEHCDFIFDINLPEPGIFVHYISSQEGARFQEFEGTEEQEPTGDTTILIDHALSSQRILGFGGTFTDVAGINIVSLEPELQEKLLRSYFGADGIDYKMGRIPIAGSYFSLREYSYDDVEGDIDLEFFELQEEDYTYKIPMITRALELAGHDIRLFGSPWSPPEWMKNNETNQGTCLRDDYREPYSQYLIKFVEEYAENNITIWGMTSQNQPTRTFTNGYSIPYSCGFLAADMRDFIANFLGPAFQEEGLSGLKLMILDDNRDYLPDYADVILYDETASSYVSGIAVHWYSDESFDSDVLIMTHEQFPDVFILYTEASQGQASPEGENVVLGSWDRAENYARNIIEDLNAYVTGWVDLNLAVDMEGGPSEFTNSVDAPIIVDPENEVFYRQPMYYALGHFSKFLHIGSHRVFSRIEGDGEDVLKAVAFHDSSGMSVCVILLNTDTKQQSVSIPARSGLYINIDLAPKSIETVLFT